MLVERELQLIVAVQPAQIPSLQGVIEACSEHGVELAIWPLLHDTEGRWVSGGNVMAYEDHLRQVIALLEREPLPMTVVFDLEPPISRTRTLLDFRVKSENVGARLEHLEKTAVHFEQLTRDVRRRGHVPIAVVPPMVLFDPPRRQGGWQRFMGTPVDDVGFEKVIVMVYTSLLEGYARGAIKRREARVLLAHLAQRAKQRFGRRAALALGVVGGGALGDERPYSSIDELADDVGISRAAGIDDLSLFGLTGVLERSEGRERWLDGFCLSPGLEALPQMTPRAAAVLAGARIASHVFDLSMARKR